MNPASPSPRRRVAGVDAGGPTSATRRDGRSPGAAGQRRAIATALRNADRLSAEDAILVADDLSADAAGPIITTDRFGETLGALEQQMLQEPMARDLTEAYRDLIESELASTPDQPMDLDRFACGLRVCMAQFRSQGEASDWLARMEALLNSKQVQFYASLDYTLNLGRAGFERRLIFSTDPDSSGIRIVPSSKP